MIRKAGMTAMTVLLGVVHCDLALAQGALTTILEIDVENPVQYFEDTSDLSKFATDPNATIATPPRNFAWTMYIGDIVAVNGQPAKGTVTRNLRQVLLNTAPNPGQAIADTVRNAVTADTFEILKSDGTPIGTMVSYGLTVGSPPLGAPLSITQGSFRDYRRYGGIPRGSGTVWPGGDSADHCPAAGFDDGGPRGPP